MQLHSNFTEDFKWCHHFSPGVYNHAMEQAHSEGTVEARIARYQFGNIREIEFTTLI